MYNKLLKDVFTVRRLVTASGKDTWTNVLTAQAGMLQPLGEKNTDGQGQDSQGFRLFTNRIDVQAKDQVVMGGLTYEVQTVRDYNFGTFPHYELTIFKV